MSEAYYKWTVDDLVIKLYYDEPFAPFDEEFEQSEDSYVITCSFFHTRSILTEVNLFDSFEEMQEWHKKHKDYELFRLMRYEHGGVSFRAFEVDEQPGYPYNCQWDAGMEGFVLAKPVDGTSAIDLANQSLEYLTNYCNGEIFRYVIENEDGEELDACCGFIGHEYAKQSAIEAAYSHVQDPTKVMEVEEHGIG